MNNEVHKVQSSCFSIQNWLIFINTQQGFINDQQRVVNIHKYSAKTG